jgi:hypothetical protein
MEFLVRHARVVCEGQSLQPRFELYYASSSMSIY